MDVVVITSAEILAVGTLGSCLRVLMERIRRRSCLNNQILYKSQYGFRKQMSTSLAIIELVEEITNSLDNHETSVGVFIDLKKAFDTVDHGILIEKRYHYGIRGIANKWICSYLMKSPMSPRIYFRANRIHTLYERYV